MRIKKTNGRYWNADQNCFSVVQAATEYKTIDDLPLFIENNDGKKLSLCECCHCYFDADDDGDDDGVASIAN